MRYDEIMNEVNSRFDKQSNLKIGNFDAAMVYTSKFELKWFATKLKIFSFVSYVDRIDENTIKTYHVAFKMALFHFLYSRRIRLIT